MAVHTITAAEVRQRLTDLTTLDISDAVLASASMIPAADGWAGRILTLNSTDVDSISADQLLLLVAAKIAFVCIRVVSRARHEEFKAGPVSIKGVTAKDYESFVKILKDEIEDDLEICGWTSKDFGFTYAGGDDFHPDGEDNTQIDFNYHDAARFDLLGGED